MKILHEWNFHNRVCRVVESEPGIVHFEEATRTTGDPSIMLFNHTPTPMGAANEIIQLSMALAEANIINRDLSAAIRRWQEERKFREQEIERLRAELAKVTEQRDAWPKYHGMATEGLMILHDRKDLQDLSDLRCGDFIANVVPHLVAEIDRLRAELAKTKLPIWMLREEHEKEVAALRARVEELEGMVPKWVDDDEHLRLLSLGWSIAGPEQFWYRPPGAIEASWHWLMVPPIPLPEGE